MAFIHHIERRSVPSLKRGRGEQCLRSGWFTLWLSILCMVVLSSCATPEYLPEKELHQYLQDEDHGLSKSVQAGALTMKMTFRPTDFLLWQELEGEEDSTKIRQAFKNYNDYVYFVLQLSVKDKDALYGTSSNQADFNEKLQTLSFRMQQYINMTTSEYDTIPLADAYYTRMFGMSQSSDVLLVFNREDIVDDEWLSINSKEFGFKTGRKSFRFLQDNIQKTPKLTKLKPYYEIAKK